MGSLQNVICRTLAFWPGCAWKDSPSCLSNGIWKFPRSPWCCWRAKLSSMTSTRTTIREWSLLRSKV